MEEKKSLARQAFERAQEAEMTYGGCSQCVALTIYELTHGYSSEVVKAASGFAAGFARQGEVCGAAAGAVMALSALYGRPYENMKDLEARDRTMELCYKVLDHFKETYGTFICADIQKQLVGRRYKMYEPQDNKAFNDDGGHAADKCPTVCGNAAKWVIEILQEEGLLTENGPADQL